MSDTVCHRKPTQPLPPPYLGNTEPLQSYTSNPISIPRLSPAASKYPSKRLRLYLTSSSTPRKLNLIRPV